MINLYYLAYDASDVFPLYPERSREIRHRGIGILDILELDVLD